jgi:hypothetical protein
MDVYVWVGSWISRDVPDINSPFSPMAKVGAIVSIVFVAGIK